MARIITGSIRWVLETSGDNATPSKDFLEQQAHLAMSRVRNVNLGYAFFDDNEERTTTVLREKYVNPPSHEMEEVMRLEFGPDEPDPKALAG